MDDVVFSDKTYQKKFDRVRNMYFKKFKAIFEEYDTEVEYILDPANNMSKSNLGFVRSIAIDHLIMEIMPLIKEKTDGISPKNRNAKHYKKWSRKGNCPGCGVGCGSDHKKDCVVREELLNQI